MVIGGGSIQPVGGAWGGGTDDNGGAVGGGAVQAADACGGEASTGVAVAQVYDGGGSEGGPYEADGWAA